MENGNNEMETKIKYGISKVIKTILMVIGGIILFVLFAFLFGYFVMLLWNWLMPMLFKLPQIDYWQALGIIVLARLIFGGHEWGGGNDGKKSKKCKKEWDREWDKEWEKEWSKEYGDEDEWKIDGGYKKWKFYSKFWKEEGKQAFEEYLKRQKEVIDTEKTENKEN